MFQSYMLFNRSSAALAGWAANFTV